MAQGGEGNDLGAAPRPGDARDRGGREGLPQSDGPDHRDSMACGYGDRAPRGDRSGRGRPIPDRGAEAQDERSPDREDPRERAPLERGRALLRRSCLHGLSGALLLLALSIAAPARANTIQLVYTLPAFNALVVDTSFFACEGGDSLHDLAIADLYGWADWDNGHRGPYVVQEHVVIGMEGKPDTFTVDASYGWHFYVVTKDFHQNPSCASNVVFACSPCQITGVPTLTGWDPVVRTLLFSVTGRVVRQPVASGIYFPVDIHRSGRRTIGRKVVILK